MGHKKNNLNSNPKRGRFLPFRVKRPIRIQVSSAPQTNSFFEVSHWHKSAGIISLDLFLKDSLEQREGKLHTIGPQCPLLENPKPDPDAGMTGRLLQLNRILRRAPEATLRREEITSGG